MDPILIGAGDIAYCGNSNDSKTAALVKASGGIPFTLGDNVYASGTASEFANCYDPTWGDFAGRTRPVVGDNEYETSGARPYFDYFGASAGKPGEGWYSYNVGTWHVVVLNSNCGEVGGCGAGSRQEKWLRADLAAAGARCIAAMWHDPRYSSVYSSSTKTRAFWQALQDYGAELVLSGHHHVYERFAPQDADGELDPDGMRQFIVGTGGRSLVSSFRNVQPNSEVRNNNTYGVLKLRLRADGYDFEFVPVAGSSFRDSGSDSCDRSGGGGPASPAPVTVPAAADARVESSRPGSNFGFSSTLVADTSPATASYVRFDVAGVGPVSRATLRFYVKDSSSNAPEVYLADQAWTEDAVTWDSRPARAGPLLADAGKASAGKWLEYDVSAAVTGDGSWSFELAGDSTDGIDFSSRDASSNRPQLVLVPAPPPPDPPPPDPLLPVDPVAPTGF